MTDDPSEEEIQELVDAGILLPLPESFIDQLKKLIKFCEEEE